jgi:hydrogenase nickel incorporation protein HypA/HybF
VHELSLCQSIQRIVERAREQRTVTTVHLEVGQLRQVVPETLVYCWGMVTEGTGLEGSVLDVDHVPVELDCRTCGHRTTVEHALVLSCSECGSGDIALVAGEEFMVTSIDVATAGTLTGRPSGER